MGGILPLYPGDGNSGKGTCGLMWNEVEKVKEEEVLASIQEQLETAAQRAKFSVAGIKQFL